MCTAGKCIRIYIVRVYIQSMAHNETGAFPENPKRISGNDVYRVRFAKKLFRTLFIRWNVSKTYNIYSIVIESERVLA